MCQCSNVPVFQCSDILIFQCFNVPMLQFSNVLMFQCSNAPMFSMFQCANALIFYCFNVLMFQCPNVSISLNSKSGAKTIIPAFTALYKTATQLQVNRALCFTQYCSLFIRVATTTILVKASYDKRKMSSFSHNSPNKNTASISGMLLWLCISTLCDWLKYLTPHSLPIRRKPVTNRDLLARVFPRLVPNTCICSEF